LYRVFVENPNALHVLVRKEEGFEMAFKLALKY